jgi:hypothetical protein
MGEDLEALQQRTFLVSSQGRFSGACRARRRRTELARGVSRASSYGW